MSTCASLQPGAGIIAASAVVIGLCLTSVIAACLYIRKKSWDGDIDVFAGGTAILGPKDQSTQGVKHTNHHPNRISNLSCENKCACA
eukprot:2732545-Amphidinium_carterae.1